jgi:hypothetical protein
LAQLLLLLSVHTLRPELQHAAAAAAQLSVPLQFGAAHWQSTLLSLSSSLNLQGSSQTHSTTHTLFTPVHCLGAASLQEAVHVVQHPRLEHACILRSWALLPPEL